MCELLGWKSEISQSLMQRYGLGDLVRVKQKHLSEQDLNKGGRSYVRHHCSVIELRSKVTLRGPW